MSTIDAVGEWDGHNWVATAPAVPGALTQARQLGDLRDRLAEAVRLMTGEPVEAGQIALKLIRYGT